VIPVATNSNALVRAIGIETYYVVQFIRHASRSRNIGNTSITHSPSNTTLPSDGKNHKIVQINSNEKHSSCGVSPRHTLCHAKILFSWFCTTVDDDRLLNYGNCRPVCDSDDKCCASPWTCRRVPSSRHWTPTCSTARRHWDVFILQDSGAGDKYPNLLTYFIKYKVRHSVQQSHSDDNICGVTRKLKKQQIPDFGVRLWGNYPHLRGH